MESRPIGDGGPPSTTTIPSLFLPGAGKDVTGLRVYGTNTIREFPSGSWERLKVANDPSAEIFINDPSVTRRGTTGHGHASIRRHGAELIVTDEGSKNGTFVDNQPLAFCELKPGSVVRFGSVSLVATSERTEAMRVRFMRMLGFDERYLWNVDNAVYAATRRMHMIVHAPPGGVDRLTRIVHDTAPGGQWPRYVVDDRIRDDFGPQRAVLKRARLGTLIIPAEFWPTDSTTLRDALAGPTQELRLVFVMPRAEPGRTSTTKPARTAEHYLGSRLREIAISIDVPPLAERGAEEINRSIHAGVHEYGIRLGLSRPVFSVAELARLVSSTWSGNAEELDESVRRVTRVRLVGLARAAELEASDATPIDTESLRRWMKRNKFPLALPS